MAALFKKEPRKGLGLKDKMKIGIIGAGAIARRGHLPICRTIPEIEVAGIADLDESLARRVAEEFKIPKYCSSCDELLQDDSIELVDICTPTPTHLDMVKMAIEKQKHILVEKPLAASLKDALEIQSLVQKDGTKLCVVQNWRYFPAVIAAKERISKGYLGSIITLHGTGLVPFPTHWTLNTWPYQQGGTLYDLGSHLIDMIFWMKDFAPVKKVYASGGDFTQGNMDFVNYAVINIEFEDGSIAIADISWVSAMMLKFTLDIQGTGGGIFLDARNNVFAETRGFSTPFDDIGYFLKKMWKVGTGVINGNYFKGANLGYKPLILGFLHSINGDGEIPVPVEQAVMANAILEAATKSILEGKPICIKELTG